MTAFDGPRHMACVLTIDGAATEGQLLAVFDEVVPARSRGLALGSILECMGVCRTVRKYEKLTFISTIVTAPVATASARIVVKSKACSLGANERQ